MTTYRATIAGGVQVARGSLTTIATRLGTPPVARFYVRATDATQIVATVDTATGDLEVTDCGTRIPEAAWPGFVEQLARLLAITVTTFQERPTP